MHWTAECKEDADKASNGLQEAWFSLLSN